jgi:hypothetical protein
MMAMVNVDVNPWDVIEEMDDDDLIEEMRDRGYSVSKIPDAMTYLDREDLDYLMSLVDDSDLYGRRVYDKLKDLRFG